jgi:hypothetical protein
MMRKDLVGTDEALTLAGMWPDDGRLISQEFPSTQSSFLGKHYAVNRDF